MQAFSNVVNDVRTQDIPLILETPAFDNTSGTQRKNQFKPGEGWDVWRTEIVVLNRLAGLRENGSSEKEKCVAENLAKWTDEIGGVVKRMSGAAQKKEQNAKTGNLKETNRRGKRVSESESDHNSDGEDSV